MILRAAAVAAAALLADGAAFALAVQHVGIAGESNPLVVSMYLDGGSAVVLASKVAQVAAVLIVIGILAARLPEYRRRWAGFLGYGVAIVGILGAATGIAGALG